jgi:hypothetical protein
VTSRPRVLSLMVNIMESETFARDMLEFWRHDNERELKNVSTLPSREEIDALKRQIRAENEAREALKGDPPYLNTYRQPKVGRTRRGPS